MASKENFLTLRKIGQKHSKMSLNEKKYQKQPQKKYQDPPTNPTADAQPAQENARLYVTLFFRFARATS